VGEQAKKNEGNRRRGVVTGYEERRTGKGGRRVEKVDDEEG
jgi:hypothetical protein